MTAPQRSREQRGGTQEVYLLFAGRHGDPARGVSGLVATFASQDEARAAFRRARLNLSNVEGWAELSVVSAGGRPKRVSWFGTERLRSGPPIAGLFADLSPDGRPGRRPLWRRTRHAEAARSRQSGPAT